MKDQNNVIMGIDPGMRVAGYGILVCSQEKTMLVDYGCIKMSPTLAVSKRIFLFFSAIESKLKQHNVTHIAIEKPFCGKNMQSFLKLGYLCGTLHLMAEQNNIAINEFLPRQIKAAVTRYGGATKEQVSSAIKMLFPGISTEQPETHDITDAIAICMCGARAVSPFFV